MAGFDRSELLEYFLSEAEEHINTLEKGITEIESEPDSDALIEDLFRSAHTLKGAAAIVKLTATSNIAHRIEDILEELQEKRLKASKKIIELLSYMLDAIKDLVRDISAGKGERPNVEQEVFIKVSGVMAEERTVNDAADTEPQEVSELTETALFHAEKPVTREKREKDLEFFSGNFVKIDLRKIDEILNLIGEITIKENHLLQKTKDAREIADEIFFAGRRLVKEVDSFAERYAYSLPGSVKYVDPLLSEFGELEFDRYNDLNLFSRKLQEITNDITEAIKQFSTFFESFGYDVKRTGKMIKLLRSDLSEARMIEVGRLFQRFVRPVKDMATQYDKKVELLISGGDTKIDRVIFERLFNPIIHIMRNSICHGIEASDERIQKGKKEEGLLLLSARTEGNLVVIEIHDNGRGIDTDKLYDEAVKRGLLAPDNNPPKEELLSLIFLPFFSTAESTDMSSGRGIGLNAVRRQVSGVNGMIEVDTNPDLETTFRIKIPSSIVITNVIVFSSCNIEFAMPASFIDEIIQLDNIDVNTDETPTVINYKGKEIHARDLSAILGIITERAKSNNTVVVCNISDKKTGLIVDAVLGQEEAIIKPLNLFIEGLYMYSGTSTSGDGKVRLVLNPVSMFEEHIQPSAIKLIDTETWVGRRILIVDDSLSVRKYLSALLSADKFKVYVASNGVEALNILDNTPVDMIITDLEMPVMHGYELITKIKSSERFRGIPLIVLTSRSTERHKEKAFQCGAQDYLVKPFDEMSVSEILKKYLPAADIA